MGAEAGLGAEAAATTADGSVLVGAEVTVVGSWAALAGEEEVAVGARA